MSSDPVSPTPSDAHVVAPNNARSIRSELLLVTAIGALAVTLGTQFDVMDQIFDWASRNEAMEVDEFFLLFIVATVGLACFAVRRWHELGLAMRHAVALHADLSRTERQMRTIFETMPNPLVVVATHTGRILQHNQQFAVMVDTGAGAVIGRELRTLELWHRKEFEATMWNDVKRTGRLRNAETELRFADGLVHPALVSAEPIDFAGEPAILAVINDISERKELERQLTHRAFHDALTGLGNRDLFRLRLDHAIERSTRNAQVSAIVLFLDLDDFKTVNDTLGHFAGDALLVQVAQRISSCIRAADTCARLGGDEFAVLLEDAPGVDEAMRLSDRLIATLQAPYELGSSIARVGVSIGVAVREPAESTEDVMRNADVAMYLSKSRGRGRHTIFESSMHEEMVERLALENDLRMALERDEFTIAYQPIVEIATRRIVSVEALVRWEHPVRGTLPPTDFIALLENSGMIVEVGRWILRKACADAMLLQQKSTDGPIGISINISGRQIAHEDIVRHVAEALAESGLPASLLTLEITESVLVHNDEATVGRLWALKGLGLHLAIDDFGTGYSSLAYLQRFPVDVLKIDKSFTDRFGTGAEESPIARAIVALGSTISMRTVAEGIETESQWQRLRELGCELGQGYLFSRPQSLQSIRDILAHQASATHDGNVLEPV